MSEKKTKVITTRQAKWQINQFGISLIFYIVSTIMLWHGTIFLSENVPELFFGMDPELLMMVFNIVMTLFTTYVLFRISAKSLKLDIHDYLQDPHLSFKVVLGLTCVGVAIMYLITVISTLFYFMNRSAGTLYSFVGYFTSPVNIIKNIVYFLLFVLIRPFCEEYVFRGIIQRQLGHFGRYFGVFASALLYAIAQPTLNDALPAFMLGWYLALITLRYHSIKPARQIHILIAFFTWLTAVLPNNLFFLPTIIIIFVYITAAFSLFERTVNYRIALPGRIKPKLWKILFSSWSIVICLILFVISCILAFF